VDKSVTGDGSGRRSGPVVPVDGPHQCRHQIDRGLDRATGRDEHGRRVAAPDRQPVVVGRERLPADTDVQPGPVGEEKRVDQPDGTVPGAVDSVRPPRGRRRR
jgi:hypothetical protein